jgi:hypothetical protein
MTVTQEDTRTAGTGAGERCEFHPGCCEPYDADCPGCGALAVTELVVDGHRIPLCADCAGGVSAGPN